LSTACRILPLFYLWESSLSKNVCEKKYFLNYFTLKITRAFEDYFYNCPKTVYLASITSVKAMLIICRRFSVTAYRAFN
jgi:hypothetical protein